MENIISVSNSLTYCQSICIRFLDGAGSDVDLGTPMAQQNSEDEIDKSAYILFKYLKRHRRVRLLLQDFFMLNILFQS